MNHAERIDKASGILFTLGLFLNKLKFIPVSLHGLFRPIVYMTNSGIYIAAYLLWVIASFLLPDHDRDESEWYGFARFRVQHQSSAIIGLLGCITGTISYFYPIMSLPASWMFLFSNAIWAISEIHKLFNPPPNDANFSYKIQLTYVYYAIGITLVSLFTTVSETLMALFPAISIAVGLTSSIYSLIMGLVTTIYWCEYASSQASTKPSTSSYKMMDDSFSCHKSVNRVDTNFTPPFQTGDIFTTPTNKHIQPDTPDLDCTMQ